MPNGSSRPLAIVAAVVITLAACGTAEEDLGIGPDATSPETDDGTVTETETVVETHTETETTSPTSSPTETPGAQEDPMRDLIVAPQEPRRVEAGSTGEFTVPGRLGGEDLPELVGFAWTPCEDVDAAEGGPLIFVDEDADGHADAMGVSDTGSARLRDVNGERYENVDDEWPVALHTRDETPALEFTMLADQADCATLVLFVDEDGDEELDLADDRTPVETYGVAEISWTG